MSGSRRGSLRGRLALAACAVTLAVATAAGLAGCGGGSDPGAVTPHAYVTSVCGALGPFEHEIATSSAALSPSAGSTPAQRKQMLESFLSSISADADRAVSKLAAAKHPDVRNGRKIAAALVDLFTRIRKAMHAAALEAERLPTGSVAAFRSADAALGRSVQASMGDLGSSLSGLRTGGLERAAARAPACRSLS